jgi:hypothetical protein
MDDTNPECNSREKAKGAENQGFCPVYDHSHKITFLARQVAVYAGAPDDEPGG